MQDVVILLEGTIEEWTETYQVSMRFVSIGCCVCRVAGDADYHHLPGFLMKVGMMQDFEP